MARLHRQKVVLKKVVLKKAVLKRHRQKAAQKKAALKAARKLLRSNPSFICQALT